VDSALTGERFGCFDTRAETPRWPARLSESAPPMKRQRESEFSVANLSMEIVRLTKTAESKNGHATAKGIRSFGRGST
jgi:hypothetical protein